MKKADISLPFMEPVLPRNSGSCYVKYTLQWNDNIRESIKKANINKRLHFIVLLKRAGVDVEDVLNFFCTVIRPALEYCAQAFHHSLPKYLAGELEVVQKRVLKIISPEMPYREALEYFKLPTLF